MPTGDWTSVEFFLRNVSPFTKVREAKRYPLRALDIGIGAGRWGFLFRDTMEFRSGRYYKHEWVYTVDGIEIHAPYRNPVWDYAYNKIDIGNIVDLITRIESREAYDFIFVMDVIEHLPKEIGVNLLDRLLFRTKNRLLLVFPDGNQPAEALKQGPFKGNEHERHQSLWTEDDVIGYNILDSVPPCAYALQGLA